MKVKFTDAAKQIVTVAELPKVREMINDLKEDTELNYYIQIMAKIAAGGYCGSEFEILKAEAEVSKNKDGVGYFADNNLDVWVRAYVFDSFCGFYVLGFYLSDCWQYSGDNTEEIMQRMYIRRFAEDR